MRTSIYRAALLAASCATAVAVVPAAAQVATEVAPAGQSGPPIGNPQATGQAAQPADAAAAADAPPAASGAPGDIVVTAQRREERLQNVGIAVSAFSGETLKAQGFTSTTELAKITPGVNVSGTLGGQGLQFSIRGVTQSDYNDAIEAPVAVYIDDTYVASQQGQGSALYDIARVEALKGPQGTLFGRNATGGLVNFVINKPELGHYTGYFDATYGRFNRVTLEGAINVPIGDIVALRASGFWNRNDSMWRNVYPAGMVAGAPLRFGPQGVSPAGQNLGNKDELAGRLQLLLEPSSDFRMRFEGSVFRQNLSESPWTSSAIVPVLNANNQVVNDIYASKTETRSAIGPNGQNFYNPAVLPFQGFLFSPNNDGRRASGASWFGYVPVDIGKRELSKDFALSNLNTFRAYNAAIHIDANVSDAVQLTSVTSYWKYKKQFLLDADGSPVDGLAFGTKSDTSTITQETRLSGKIGDAVDWQAGVFYLYIDADVAQGLLAPRGSALSAVFGLTATGVDPLSVFNLKTESGSLFGQFNWRFAPRLTLVLGARGIREHQDYVFASYATQNVNDYAVDVGPPLFTLQPSFNDSRTNTLWAGKAQLEFRPTDRILLYGGVNRGVKGGSYNGKLFDGTPPLSPANIPYKPEVLLSYEGGFKITGPTGRYTINGAAYHYDYSNYQSFVFADISGFVRNQKARTTGAELEGTWRATDFLRVAANGAFVDAKVLNLQIAPGVFRDTRPTYTPKWSASGRATLSREVAGGRAELTGIVTYQSSFYQNARNFDGDLFDSRTITDFNIDWSAGKGLHLGAFLKNAFDVRYKTVGLDLATACGCNLEAYGDPRTWGVKVGYRF